MVKESKKQNRITQSASADEVVHLQGALADISKIHRAMSPGSVDSPHHGSALSIKMLSKILPLRFRIRMKNIPFLIGRLFP